ncbi:MAG: response regulator transcription factor [Bryobacteraceae bacterium]
MPPADTGDGSAAHPYRLVIADDRDDIREEIRRLLSPDFEVVAAVPNGMALMEAAAQFRPDAVLCDIYMPGPNGLECGARLLRGGLCRAVIVLTMHNEPHLVGRALEIGIHGYVLKEDASSELVSAIHAALAGRRYLSRGVAPARVRGA